VAVEMRVLVVGDLGGLEPGVPLGDELFERQIPKIQVVFA